MSYDFHFSKGKGKRPAENDFEPQYMSRSLYPVLPTVVRRLRHRRRNVAATVWGRQLPIQPANLPGEPFNVYKAIVRHPNLFFQFAIRLDIDTLIDLYAIDKEFHFRFNKYSISIVHEHAMYHAPVAAYIFSWIMFPELCISDPMARPMDGRPHLARDIPSLRWTRMVLFREYIVDSILALLALEGLRVPRAARPVVMKTWLLTDMKTMKLRTAFLSNKLVWTDKDILMFHHFLVKLDMRFSHPIVGQGMSALSHMLLTQKTLMDLHNALAVGAVGLDWTYDAVTEMVCRTYTAEDLDLENQPWLADEFVNGVPVDEWGLLSKENRHADGARLVPAVDMILTEGIRRGLNLHKYFLDCVTYGFVKKNENGEVKNVPRPRKWRTEKQIHVEEEGFPTKKDRTALIQRMASRTGIAILTSASAWTAISVS
ncbi:hypothetical protein DM02DRAFT_640067 [Periconia macrospinosa]|uniref:Uncharacterized protein n=1 Tax=Periconia macrospinosa TaxID=97972 RepID=A0A2V1E4U7_9PLEO|nr:hypothetical protein DM02DRAFT_640067 [Periconia macrospinosa]